MQTEKRVNYKLWPNVDDYRLTYYMKDYQVHINDLLAAFRVKRTISIITYPLDLFVEGSATNIFTYRWERLWIQGPAMPTS